MKQYESLSGSALEKKDRVDDFKFLSCHTRQEKAKKVSSSLWTGGGGASDQFQWASF